MASTMKEEKSSDEQFEKMAMAFHRKYQVLYFNVLQLAFFHVSGLYGLYLCFTSAKWATILFFIAGQISLSVHLIQGIIVARSFAGGLTIVAATIGVNAGAHRLWCHRAYKAKPPLQIILMLFHCLSFQDQAARWARDHRLHHKYSDTDADPYNASRGVFFCHIGWLMVKKHPEVIRKGNTIDVKDIYDNPVLQFQSKYFLRLTSVIAFLLPTITPMYFWGETFANAFGLTFLRLVFVLNGTFMVNSIGHGYGYKPYKPYDKTIASVQSIPVSLATLGECFHNFHHVFPFDYRTGELGNNCINFTTKFIDFFAWVGWAYDLKSASEDMVMNRAKRTGDGTDLWGRVQKDFKNEGDAEEPNIWGWGDDDMSEGDKDKVLLLNKYVG